MPRIHLLSYFGSSDRDSGYAARQQYLHRSAESFGGIDVQHPMAQDELKRTAFYQQHQEILDKERGAGFWLWKPYLILQLLKEIPENDFLMYHDVGRALSRTAGIGYRFRRPVTPLVDWADAHGGMFPGVHVPDYGPASRWTRRDCFFFMDCDSPQYWSVALVQAGINVWKNTPTVRAFVGRWLEYCVDPRILTDQPNQCGLDNLPDFRDHRHDQSVLSNMILKEGIEVYNRPTETLFRQRDVNYLSMRVAVDDLMVRPENTGKPGFKAIASNTDPARKTLNAAACYTLHMAERRDSEVSLIEVSNRPNTGFEFWYRYLPNARISSSYPGARPDHLSLDLQDRVTLHSIDPSHRPSLELFCNRLANDGESFDYVIVRGAQRMRDQQLAIAVLFPALKPGGYLFIEGVESARPGAAANPQSDLMENAENSTLKVIRRINVPEFRYSSRYFSLGQVRYLEKHADVAGVHWSADYATGIAVIRRGK